MLKRKKSGKSELPQVKKNRSQCEERMVSRRLLCEKMGGRTSKRPELDVEEKEERKKRTAGGQEKQKPVRGKQGQLGIPG
jgi:hypothetical protein